MGRLVFPGVADGAVALGAEEDGAGPESAGDRVEGLGQARLLAGRGLVLEERAGVVRGLDDPREHHAGFLVAEALAEEPAAAFHRREDHRAVVRRGVSEGHAHAAGRLRRIVLEAVRHREDGDFLGQGALLPELPDGAHGESRDLLGQLRERRDFVRERARDADALLGFDHILELHAGDALELLPGAESGEREELPDGRFRQLGVVPGRFHAQSFQLLDRPAPDAPDILRRELAEHFLDVLRAVHVAPALELWILFAKLRGDLRERLRRGDTNGNRDGRILPAGARDLPGEGGEIDILHPRQVQEGLVDGVLFHRRGEAAEHFLNPARHVAVQREIGREHGDVVPFHDVPDLEIGVAHLDAERLRLVGTGHRAAVVVGQHDDRFPVQVRTENPFARSEEIVAVGQGVHGSLVRPS